MAVVVTNMDMPACCHDCKFYIHKAPFEIPYCQFGGYVQNPYHREDFCPLEEYINQSLWSIPENCY